MAQSVDPSSSSRFPAHGHVELESTDTQPNRMLRFEATGPFNLELAKELRDALTPIYVETASQGPFGDITTFYDSMLATPEAFAEFTALIAEWRAAGIAPTAAAYVVGPEVEGRTVVLDHYRHAWEGVPFEIFERLEDAETWVAKRLADSP